jgi:hypothetical protein
MYDYPETLRAGEHLQLAEDFYRDFCVVPRRTPPESWPRYFMLCHASELALKAYLFHYGATPKELKASGVRHSLTELQTRATNNGLSLSPKVQDDINWLNKAHEAFWHRYPREQGGPVATIDQFQPAVRELLDAVNKAIYSTGVSPSP